MKKPALPLNHLLKVSIWSVFLSMLLTFQSRAENLFWPMIGGSRNLMLSNSSKEVQPLWIVIKGEKFFKEILFTIPSQGKLHLSETDFLPPGLEYAIKTASPQVSVQREVEDGTWMDGNPMTSPQVNFQFGLRHPGFARPSTKLAIQNQNFRPQNVLVNFLDQRQKILKTETLKSLGYFQTSTHAVNPPAGTASVEVLGQGRLHVRLWTGKNRQPNESLQGGRWQEGQNLRPIEVAAPASQSYFLLSNESRSDSFVVAIRDPAQIRQAREILEGDRVFMLFGQIEATEKSWNRPFHGPDKTPWSWSVSQVTNFAEIGSIVCDSTPALVEESLPVWLRQQDICFWGFRLVRELKPNEVRWGRLHSNQE